MSEPDVAPGRGPSPQAWRWFLFLLVFAAVLAYVSWHGGEHAQLARSFLRRLLHALF